MTRGRCDDCGEDLCQGVCPACNPMTEDRDELLADELARLRTAFSEGMTRGGLASEHHERSEALTSFLWSNLDAIEAALRRTPRSVSGLWQPIETAPKDGTFILAWVEHPHRRFNSHRPDDYNGVVSAKWIDHNGGGWTWHGISGTVTRWQPLPEPPTRAALQSIEGEE